MHIRKGDRLRSKGALLEARAEYRKALRKDPDSSEYKKAIDELDSEIEERAADAVADARAMQRKGRWLAAAEKFDLASKYKPYDSELKAHRALSELKSKGLDTYGWYGALTTLANELTGSSIVKKSLKKAKKKAYQEQLGAGRMSLDEGKGTESHQAFQKAREIDPAMPGVSAESLDKAEALFLADQAKVHWDKGDAVSAYEAYQAAYNKMKLPEIKTGMQMAQRKASRIIKLLDQAKNHSNNDRYAAAVATYERLGSMDGVPDSVKEAQAKAVEKLIESLLNGAEQDIDRDRLSAGGKKIGQTLRHLSLNDEAKKALKTALGHLSKKDPGQAINAIEQSGLSRDERVVVVITILARATAESVLAAAKRLPSLRASQALAMLSGLTVFMDELPEVRQLRRSLFKTSFASMLEEAKRQSKRGNDSEAANILLEAVEATAEKAPPAMQEPMRAGCAELKAKKFIQAEKSFDQALAAAPRSRIAKVALNIAQTRKTIAEKNALATVKRGVGKVEQAVMVLEGLRIAAPGTRSVRQASEALLGQLKKLGDRGADRNIAQVLAYLARLEEISDNARNEILQASEALKNGQYKSAEVALKRAEDAAVESSAAPLGRKIAHAKWLSGIELAFNKAPVGTEAGAKALAALLAASPQHKAGKAALTSLLQKAKDASKAQDDATASQFLVLATIATAPDASVASHLASGHESLASGDTNSAERSYRAALQIDVDQAVARTGREIARGNRSSILTNAVNEAIEGRGLEQLKSALTRSWEADSEDPDLQDALDELLASAEKKMSIGLMGEAVALLSSINVITAQAVTRNELDSANAQLAKGEYAAAAQTYAKHEKTSKLAAAGLKIARTQDRQRLLAGVQKLKTGGDLVLGARLTAELLALEPASPEAMEAIQATIARAGKGAAKGQADVVIRELSAANKAGGGDAAADAAIALLEGKKFVEAAEAFAGLSGDLGKRGSEFSRKLRTLRLRAGMNQDDSTAAESIRALLEENPSDKQALRSLKKLLDKAKGLARKGSLEKSASVFTAAVLASGAPEDLADKTRTALSLLADKKPADAEHALNELLSVAKDSQVLKAAQQAAKAERQKVQNLTLRALKKGESVNDNAKSLAATLVADPKSRSVKQAIQLLYGQARSLSRKDKDAQIAERITAIAALEQIESDKSEAITAASGLLAASKLEEAEKAFASINVEDEKNPIKLAITARDLVRSRRVAVAKADLSRLEKDGEVIKASIVAEKVLTLAPKDRAAQSASRKYKGRVIQHRLKAAAAQRKLGKLGAAHLFLSRVLKIDERNSTAKKELAAVESELKKRLNFIVLIEKVARDMQLNNSNCKKVEGWMRDELIRQGSKNKSLGMYVVPPEWTLSVDKKESGAPTPSGGLMIKIKKCMNGSSTGEATVEWALLVPQTGKAVVEGSITASVPKGVLPKDEQDEAGINARKQLSRYVAKAIIAKLENERSSVDAWLLTLAEYWMTQKKPALVADSYARGLVKANNRLDRERAFPIEAYLAEAFE